MKPKRIMGTTITEDRTDRIIKALIRMGAEEKFVDLYELANAMDVKYDSVYYWTFGRRDGDVNGFVQRYPGRFNVARSAPNGSKPRIIVGLTRVPMMDTMANLIALRKDYFSRNTMIRSLMRDGRFLDAVGLELYERHVQNPPMGYVDQQDIRNSIDRELFALIGFERCTTERDSKKQGTPHIDDKTWNVVIGNMIERMEIYVYYGNVEKTTMCITSKPWPNQPSYR